ncbi:murein hydrolase activator EnvC [Glaciecola sp. KUL10]|uniref:murein hydrolase activator EnvC family protein n=1 Tax=Glaciecola sp. (strain KUL10) TaxID=2161813 RepID=UPI000D96CD0E|nr:peptidoglycan DD-metalloendopeptidase family protein [Glaciecola sp. KUL10]GBL03793.1 peptidase, M23/M37 family protein [Glaciecola sp. KUL10]
MFKLTSTMRKTQVSLRDLGFVVLLSLIATASITKKSHANDLESIQNLIKQTQAALTQNLEASERLQQELKLAELEIAKTATQLNQTDRSLTNTRLEMQKLEEERTRLRKGIEEQQALLANQLKSAYMAGDYDFAKMLFNQEDAGRFERVLTYYQYLNKARKSQIDEFRGIVQALESVELELRDKEVTLDQLLSAQKSQADKLRGQQQARHIKLQTLDTQIKTDTARVKTLQQEERSLLDAIEQAEIAAQARARAQEEVSENVEIVLNGLKSLKGKLDRPTAGKMRALFGKRRQGQVRWKGVIFTSEQGVPVQAVHDGKVLYADWLKGFGLVTIVDHGEGYMTVYGRNQALLKEPGQTVLAGETIGLVGNSGGQASTGLYFELRHKGKALNPSQWLRR